VKPEFGVVNKCNVVCSLKCEEEGRRRSDELSAFSCQLDVPTVNAEESVWHRASAIGREADS